MGLDLKRKREQLGLTQTELARHLDVKLATVYRWEKLKKVDRVVSLAMKELERQLKK